MLVKFISIQIVEEYAKSLSLSNKTIIIKALKKQLINSERMPIINNLIGFRIRETG